MSTSDYNGELAGYEVNNAPANASWRCILAAVGKHELITRDCISNQYDYLLGDAVRCVECGEEIPLYAV